jgi:hypothetical protein
MGECWGLTTPLPSVCFSVVMFLSGESKLEADVVRRLQSAAIAYIYFTLIGRYSCLLACTIRIAVTGSSV